MSLIDHLKTTNTLIHRMSIESSSESDVPVQLREVALLIQSEASSAATAGSLDLKERVKIFHFRSQIAKKFAELLSSPGSFMPSHLPPSMSKTAIESILEDSYRISSVSAGEEISDLVKNQDELEELLELPPELPEEEKIQMQMQFMQTLTLMLSPEEKTRLDVAWTEGLFTFLGHAEYTSLLETAAMQSYLAPLTIPTEIEESLTDRAELTRLYEMYGIFYRSEEGENLLHLACKIGSEAWVNFLLEQGCDLGCKSSAQEAPLHFAVSDGNPKIVSMLLRRGAAVEKNLHGCDPTHMAAIRGNISILQIFADNGISLNNQSSKGKTPLYLSAQYKHDSVCEHLLSLGVDATIAPNAGFPSILNLAILYNLERFAAKLIPLRIDLLKEDKFGEIPLTVACDSNRTSMAKLLIEHAGIPIAHARSVLESVVLADNFELLKQIETYDPAILDMDISDGEDVYASAYFSSAEKILSYVSPKPRSRFYITAKSLAAFSGIDTFISHKDMTFRSLIGQPYPFYIRCAEAVPDSFMEIKTALREASKKSRTVDEILETAKSGKLVVIATGWDEHAISIVTDGKTMILCNRGDRPPGFSALHGFDIDKPENLTRELVETIILMDTREGEEASIFFLRHSSLTFKQSRWYEKHIHSISTRTDRA